MLSRAFVTLIFMTYAASLPTLTREWAMSATQAGLVQTSFSAGFAISLFGTSWLADHLGARRMFLWFCWLGAAAALAFALLARSFEDGSTTVELAARAFLDRIDAVDPTVQAWVHVDPEAVLARARQLDRLGPAVRGPLHGIPIGIKDIFDTYDMPTAYGSPIHGGHRPTVDAASFKPK